MTTTAWSSGTTYYASAFDYAGSNGMQVAMDISWSAVSEGSTTAVATVKIYTDNQYSYSDAQTLNVSSNLGSNYNYTNNSGASEVLRLTRTYTHTYTAGSYNSSPGSVTFSASVSGTYNGSAPVINVTGVAIPARPSHAPTAPTSVTATPNNGSISVSFAGPSDGGTGGVAYYQSSPNNTDPWTSYISNPFTISGTNGTSTTGYVRAVSNYGGYGPSASASATPRTTPSAPTSFVATANTFGTVALSWVAPNNGGNAISSYTLTRTNGATTVTLTAPATNATTYNDTTVNPAVSYTYTLLANNGAGAGATASVTITSLGGIARVWNGTVYVTTLPKVWNGTIWADAQARMWNGTEWKHGI
jgi:hypothetical protein